VNLSELVFKTNTDDLDKVIKKLDEVGVRVQNLTKVQEKAAVDSAKADKAAASAQDAQNKAAISGIKLEEAKAKAASGAASAVTASSDKAAAFLQRLEDKISFMTKSFSSGQASILAYGKALGLTEDQLKGVGSQLDLVRKLQGNDPFDKSLGAVKALTTQYSLLKESVRLYNTDAGLSRAQTIELAREKLRLIEAAKAEGIGFQELRNRIREVQSEYINTARSANVLTAAQKSHEVAIKNSAQANAFLDKEMRRAANAADEANKSLGKTTNNGLFRFQEALNKSGLTLDQQKKKLDEYKASLATVDQIAGSGGNKTDYISRAIGPQITDIVVGLSTGQSPLTVMLQQGGQLRDQLAMNKVAAADMAMTMRTAARDMVSSIKSVAVGMGGLVYGIIKDSAVGIGNIAMNVTRLTKAFDYLTQYALRVDAMMLGTTSLAKAVDVLASAFRFAFATGILLAVTALILVGVEMFKVMQTSTDLSRALNLSGASMGTNVTSLKALASGMTDTGKSTSYLMEAFTEVAKAGVFSSKEFEAITRSAIDMERYAGVAVKDTVAAFKELKGDPLKALEELGKSTGLVSITILENVRSLLLQGKTAEATALAMKTLQEVNATIAANIKKDMSPLDLAWVATKEGISRATNELVRFIENGVKLKASTWYEYATAIATVAKSARDAGKFIYELQKTVITLDFTKAKSAINDFYTYLKARAEQGFPAPDWVKKLLRLKAPDVSSPNLREIDAAQGAQDTAEMIALNSKLADSFKTWSALALDAMTPVQKAQMELNQLAQKAFDLSKAAKEGGLPGIPAATAALIDAAVAKAERNLAAARFAEQRSGLPQLSDATTANYEAAKSAAERELALVEKTEKEKLDLLKTSYDQDKITTLQYIVAKQQILRAEGDSQLDILKKEQDTLFKEKEAFVAKTLGIRDKLLAANSAANTGETPTKAAEVQKNITEDAQRKIDDFLARYNETIAKINSTSQLLGARLFTDLAQSTAEYGKNLKSLQKQLDDFNVTELKRIATLDSERKSNIAQLWASPEQVAVIKAQEEETKRFIPIVESFAEALRKAKKEYDSLFDSQYGPPDLNPVAIQAGLDAYAVAKSNLDIVLAKKKEALDKAGVDAALDYEEKQRSEFANKISDALVTALFEGGKSGSKAIRNAIVAELKKPITLFIQASVNALFSGGSGGGGFLGDLLSSLTGSGGGDGSSSAGNFGIIGSLLSAGSSAMGGAGLAGAIGAFTNAASSGVSILGALETGLSAFTGGLTASLGVLGPIGLAIGAIAAILSSLGVFNDKTGIKIDNSVRDGNGRADLIDSALGQFDVSGDIENKVFAPLIKSVNSLDSYIAKNLLSEEALGKVKERIQSISSNMTDWFGFEDEAGAKVAVEKASKLFLQQRYSTAFDEINTTIAAQIRNFSGTADELLKFLNDTLGVLAVLKQAEPTLTGIFGQLVNIEDLVAAQNEGESLTDAFTRLVGTFQTTSAIATLMGKTSEEAFGAVGLASLEAREALVKYAGGVSQLQSTLKYYMDNFYSDSERSAFAMKSAQDTLNAGFNSLGLVVPKSRDEFRRLVEGIDTSTDAGAKLFAALLALAPAMTAVTEITDAVNTKSPFAVKDNNIELLQGMAADSISSLFRKIISEAKSAEEARALGEKYAGQMFFDSITSSMLDKISSMIVSSIIEPMSTQLLNSVRLAGVEQVATAVQTSDIQKVAASVSAYTQETAAVTSAATTTTGATVGATNLAAGGTFAATTVASGASFAAEVITEGGLNAAILFDAAGRSMGEAVVGAAAVVSAVSASAVSSIVSMIGTMVDVLASPEFRAAFSAFTSAMGTFSAAIFTGTSTIPGYTSPSANNSSSSTAATEKNLRQEAYDLLVAAINKEKELIKLRLDLINDIYDATISAIKTLSNEVTTLKALDYASARAFIDQAVIEVALGNLPDATKYKDAVSAAVSGIQGSTYSSKFEEQLAKLKLLLQLQTIADNLLPQKTDAEMQLEYLDGLLVTAKAQLDAVNGTTLAVMSLSAALANWAAILNPVVSDVPVVGNPLPITPVVVPVGNPIPVVPIVVPVGTPLPTGGGPLPLGSLRSGNSVSKDSSDNSLAIELRLVRAELVMLRAETRANLEVNTNTSTILTRVNQGGTSLQIAQPT
jgi:hypothetical protein